MKQILKLIEFARALKPARQDLREFHVCGIFRKNKLISLACNTRKSHPLSIRHNYPFASKGTHAELLAILRGKQENYKGYDLFVLRLDNNGKINYSKPCPFCTELIKKTEFSNVWYSVVENYWRNLLTSEEYWGKS